MGVPPLERSREWGRQIGDHAVDPVAFGGQVLHQARGGDRGGSAVPVAHAGQQLPDLLAVQPGRVRLGRPFPAHPDLVARLRLGAPLDPVRERYFMYVGGADGCNDHPALDGQPSVPSSDSIVATDGARVA
jgi:hypothetical protein